MADIGEVRAKITADVSSFTTGMQSAQASVASLQGSLAPATQTTKTFYEGVEQAGIFASGSERGIRRMELALGAMAAEATGAAGAIGTLGEGLLLFSGGSALALAALGVIAEVAGIYHLATASAAEFAKENDKLAKGFEGAESATARHRIQLDELRAKYGEVVAEESRVRANLELLFDPNSTHRIYEAAEAATIMNQILAEERNAMDEARKSADKLAESNARIFLPILEARDKLASLNAAGPLGIPQLTDAQVRREAEVRAASEGKSPAEQKKAGDAAVELAHLDEQMRLEEALRQLAEQRSQAEHSVTEAADDTLQHLKLQTAEVEANIRAVQATGHSGEAFWSDADIANIERMKLDLAGISVQQQQIIDEVIAHAHAERDLANAQEAARTAARLVTEETRKNLREMQEIGKSAVQQLVEGITQGTLDLGKILEGIITRFITDHVTTALFAALGIASPSKVGIEAGQYVAQGLGIGMMGTPAMTGLGDLRLRLSMDASGMPPAMSPFDAARDHAWQRLFRETSLVANQGGFAVP